MSATTAAAILRPGVKRLRQAGVNTPERDARLLLAHAMGTCVSRLGMCMDRALSAIAKAGFEALIERRAQHEPVAYILGRRHFWRHEFAVNKSILDPRPETEALVAAALNTSFARVLDLGTGSGCILISLLAERPDAWGVGSDLSEGAVVLAHGNGHRIGVNTRAEWVVSDWFDAIDGEFDLIVSNPPYLDVTEMARAAPELRHEPRMALTDERDGLSAYRIIAASAGRCLAPGGCLMVEVGAGRSGQIAEIFHAAGWQNIEIRPDLDGRGRVVVARVTPSASQADEAELPCRP